MSRVPGFSPREAVAAPPSSTTRNLSRAGQVPAPPIPHSSLALSGATPLVDLHLRGPESGSCPFRWQVHRQAAGTERGKLAAQGVLLKASPAASLTCHCPEWSRATCNFLQSSSKAGCRQLGMGPASQEGRPHTPVPKLHLHPRYLLPSILAFQPSPLSTSAPDCPWS